MTISGRVTVSLSEHSICFKVRFLEVIYTVWLEIVKVRTKYQNLSNNIKTALNALIQT